MSEDAIPGLAPPTVPAETVAERSRSRMRELAENYPLPTWRVVAWPIMTLLVGLAIWANFAKLDEVSTAPGNVVPAGQVKVIQHLEGGVVENIWVHEGDLVKEGQKLMDLDLPISAMNKDEIAVRIDGIMIAMARMKAESDGTPLVFPADAAKRHPDLVAAEQLNYDARKRNFDATQAVMAQEKLQRSLELQELVSKQKTLQSSLALAQQRLDMSSALLRQGLTNKMDNVDAQNAVQDLSGQLETLKASLPRAQAAIDEAERRMDEQTATFERASQADLADAQLQLDRDRQLMAQATSQSNRSTITSPIDGIVKNLRMNTIGGVVRPGEEIMEVVPVHDRLNIEARLSPIDRGYVEVGQKAVVKITAYDYTRYGGLDGTVTVVDPDTTVSQENQPYYRVIIETNKAALGEHDEYPITPGMGALVDIHTGQRSVLRYLVTPVLKLQAEAFRER